MKKILAFLTAITLIFSLAACGDQTDPQAETTTPDVSENITSLNEEATTSAEEDATAVDATTVEGETTASGADMTKAEFVKFINAETAKIAKSGKYSLVRKCNYTKAVDIGSATDIINGIIRGIDESQDLNSVIGNFLGMGTTQGNVPKDDIKGDYRIVGSSLNESDLGSFKASDGTYTFTLANVSNPKKTGATPFSRFSRDFVTEEEVVDSIAEFTGAIKVKSTNVNYRNIKVEVKVADGKITSMSYSYDFDAELSVTALVATITGDGAAVNTTTYSNITY